MPLSTPSDATPHTPRMPRPDAASMLPRCSRILRCDAPQRSKKALAVRRCTSRLILPFNSHGVMVQCNYHVVYILSTRNALPRCCSSSTFGRHRGGIRPGCCLDAPWMPWMPPGCFWHPGCHRGGDARADALASGPWPYRRHCSTSSVA